MSAYTHLLKKLAIAAMCIFPAGIALGEGDPVTVTVDRAKVFRIEEPASTVIVGNPFIADVSMQDRFTVVVTGKSFGTTNLVILDEDSAPIIDEVIVVKSSEENTVSITRNSVRQTYSCSPVCEATLRVGDSTTAFDEIAKQAATRNELSSKAAGSLN